MGDENIDSWWWRMESHKRKGHQVIGWSEFVEEIPINEV